MVISERQIMEGALDAWNKWGYHRATIRRIAESAHVGEGTVLRLFPDKQTLMRKALAWEVERFTSQLTATGDLRSDLASVTKAYQSLFARRARLVLDLILEFPKRKEIRELSPMIVAAATPATEIIAAYQSSGALYGQDAWEAQLALVAPLFLPILRQEPWQHLSGGPAARVDSFLRGWRKT